MNSLAPLPDRSVQHAVAQVAESSADAANDSAADLQVEPEEIDTHNPLWSVTIAGACLFATLAAVMAFS